jgi:RNA polymerase sigma-70 factor (ECF subfamily)
VVEGMTIAEAPGGTRIGSQRPGWIGKEDTPEIVAAIRAGDKRAHEAIFRAYYAPLAAFAFRYLQNADAAEEVVQDVFTALWMRQHRIAVRGTLESYLYGAVRYGALNVIARQRVEASRARRVTATNSDDHADARSAEQQYIVDEQLAARSHALRHAIATLPKKRRAVFQLRATTHMSYAAIAEVLRTSIKNVEVQLRRATHALRASLSS